MRRAMAVAAALALAACRVDVEGAQCAQPGSAEQCPSGQVCGNDGRCSEAAAQCATSCVRDARRCTGTEEKEYLETCSVADDPVCGTWVKVRCADDGKVCEGGHADAACVACTVPGEVGPCVDGQACGNDLRCSAEAAACMQTRCEPGAKRCAGTATLETCSAEADPVCGTWVATSCEASGRECTGAGATTACVQRPCSTPGATAAECPSGQACGNDLACSAQVAACVGDGSFCVAGVERRCRDNGRERCDAGGACGAWTVVEACGALVCDAGSDACVCAAPGPGELYVDAGAGGSDPRVVPNGAAAPPGCRLASIPAALAAATSGTTVRVVGDPATYAGPFHVGRGVALVAGDTPLAPAWRIVENSATAGAGVTLEEGARLAGFTVRASPGDPRPVAVATSCAGVDKVTLENVVVDAAADASHAVGIELRGACDVDLADVRVSAAATTGLDVGMDTSAVAVRMTGGRVEQCGTGIVLTRGDLRLDGAAVVGNVGTGVVAGDGERDTQFSSIDAVFATNADTALELFGNARVDLERNRLCQNLSRTAKGATNRKAGGIWAHAAPPSSGLVFKGNEIHDNEADQVLVSSTTQIWNFDGGAAEDACSVDRNLFVGYPPAGRGLVATSGASATARWNGWAGITPTPGEDYEVIGTGTIDAGLPSAFCEPVPAPRPCP